MIDRQAREIKTEQGLLMKKLGVFVRGINGDKSCVGTSDEFHTGN